ncbi:unnamed protein product, partial [Amoebophrya sp. A25]|eukprot:GSA25T00001176001.1
MNPYFLYLDLRGPLQVLDFVCDSRRMRYNKFTLLLLLLGPHCTINALEFGLHKDLYSIFEVEIIPSIVHWRKLVFLLTIVCKIFVIDYVDGR